MYQFSRSIYRELYPDLGPDRCSTVERNHERLLHSCEAAVERLANDRHYFARPVRTLFNDIRELFPIEAQLRVYSVIERHMRLAAEYVECCARSGESLTGAPLECHATTRRGTACRREPLPGSRYCPSHKHLENEFEIVNAA